MPHHLLDIATDASSSDFDDDDFLDIADEFGHVVDRVPEDDQTGFADFPLSGFIEYSRRLVVLARTYSQPQPSPGISNDLELAVAKATRDALASELDKKYQGQTWLPMDPYVFSHVQLYSAIRNYEKLKHDEILQQTEQASEADALAADSQGGES
jgi:hypothetical protein